MLKRISVLLVGLCLSVTGPAKALSHAQVDALAHAFMEKNHVHGMSIAVLDQGKTHFFNYGYADEVHEVKASSDTLYALASFTKTITGTLAARAAADGKLNLDQSFTQYFPDLKNNLNISTITTRELLGHAASLPFEFKIKPASYADMIETYNSFVPASVPGSVYGYSNVSIGTVGYVLQNIYGLPYQTILEENLLKPLDMHATFLSVPAAREKFIAVGHDVNNQIVAYNRSVDIWFAAASLKSTIRDMAKYLNAHMDASTVRDTALASAIPLAHINSYCFDDKISCEQLAWQAHVISFLHESTGDTGFLHYDEAGNPVFELKPITQNPDFAKNKIFIDKTCTGYGMAGYMAYLPDEKRAVVILMNKALGEEKVVLGRAILTLS